MLAEEDVSFKLGSVVSFPVGNVEGNISITLVPVAVSLLVGVLELLTLAEGDVSITLVYVVSLPVGVAGSLVITVFIVLIAATSLNGNSSSKKVEYW